MSSNPIAGLKEGQKIVIFRTLKEPVEKSFVYAIFPGVVITSLGTILTPETDVRVHVTESIMPVYPVSQSAIDAKIKYLCYPGDVPNPPSEPE